MPDLYRITLGFSGKRQGWTESFVIGQDQTTPAALSVTVVQPISLARKNLLAREYTLDFQRVAKFRLSNGTPVKRNVTLWTPELGPDLQTVANSGEQPRACALVTGTGTDGEGQTQIFMRGIPDEIAVNGGAYAPSGASGWGSRFSSWRSLMIGAGAGWLEDVRDGEPFLMTDYVINPNATVQFNFEGTPFAGLDVGSTVAVRLSGINGGSRLNGFHELIVGTQNTATTKKALAVFPYSFGGQGQKYLRPKPFQTADDWFVNAIRTHDTGRPLNATRGRQPAQARG